MGAAGEVREICDFEPQYALIAYCWQVPNGQF